MVLVNMPSGGVQDIEEAELLWLRKAFDGEWKGATMLQPATDRIYSNESVSDLSEKFEEAKVPLAEFSAPEAKVRLVVSAKRVRKVVDADPVIYNDKAKSVLMFAGKLRLAVRENRDEARKRLEDVAATIA